MAELATLPANRAKLSPGVTLVSADMVGRVEQLIDRLTERFPAVTEFVIPGGDRVAASLDVARTVVRRAERRALPAAREAASLQFHAVRAQGAEAGGARGRERSPDRLQRACARTR